MMVGGRFIVVILALCSALPARSDVVVNEVLYDPAGRDEGLEFVELHNTGDLAIQLSGWTLETGNGSQPGQWTLEWTGLSGDTIGAGGFFVIAEESLAAVAQALTALDLQNGPDGCRLTAPDGETDIVGWGDLAFREYFEGNPAGDVSSGASLGRDPDGQDTGSNRDDFRAIQNPSPGQYNRPPFDLSLERAGLSRHSPPANATIDIVCHIRNSGTRACGSGCTLSAAIGYLTDSTLLYSDIEPGQTSRAVVRLPNPGRGIHTARIWHRYDADRWHSNDTLKIGIAIHPTPVVVNEIMFDPGMADCEWVEIYNGGPEPVNLDGWTLGDHSGKPKDIARTGLWLPAGGYVVLVEDEEVFTRKHPELGAGSFLRPAGGWPTLNDADGPLGYADKVILRDASGTMIDSVAYRKRWSETGVSTERINPDACSWSAGNWSPHFGRETGSPGERNTVSFCLPSGDRLLSLNPRAFSPDNDGEADMLSVSVTLPGAGLARLMVFDVNGGLVKRLVDGEVIETNRITFWDGSGRDAADAPTGIYIVLLEARMLATPDTYRSMSPVVLVRD